MKKRILKPTLNQYLGLYIRDLREYNGLNQTQLGKKLNISHAAISDIELGKTNFSFEDFINIISKVDPKQKN